MKFTRPIDGAEKLNKVNTRLKFLPTTLIRSISPSLERIFHDLLCRILRLKCTKKVRKN